MLVLSNNALWVKMVQIVDIYLTAVLPDLPERETVLFVKQNCESPLFFDVIMAAFYRTQLDFN